MTSAGLAATFQRKTAAIREADLKHWKMLKRFRAALDEQVESAGGPSGSWSDLRRRLALSDYLSLFLFGLFNPVVKTMRGLCEASVLSRVQSEVCTRAVSLGSFSEAQALVEPQLLQALFEDLAGQSAPRESRLAGLTGREMVVDSTVWQVLPRMAWAFWRSKSGSQGGPDNAVRLHVHFDLTRDRVRRVELTPAKVCEREAWEDMAKAGEIYIGDRYYSYDYRRLLRLLLRGVDFIVRLRLDAQWVLESEQPLSAADRDAGVIWAGTVRLGKEGAGPRVRVIRLRGQQDENILLATTLPLESAQPDLLAVLYRHRWQVEMFFRWLKCILGCRHWLAESPRGVALQVYLALIAAQLLVLYGGQRPKRRQMEAIQFYTMGWCDEHELLAHLKRTASKKRKTA